MTEPATSIIRFPENLSRLREADRLLADYLRLDASDQSDDQQARSYLLWVQQARRFARRFNVTSQPSSQ